MEMKRIGISLIISWLAACSTTLNPPEDSYSMQEDSLRTVYYQLADSLNQAWNVLRKDDATKNARLQRLLSEMEQTGNYAADTLDSLESRVEQLAQLEYDSVTVGNEHRVHRYDSATVAISEAVVQYAETRAGYTRYPGLVYLTEKILDANRSMMLYRLSYDRYSRRFNQFLDEHHGLIAVLDSNGTSAQRRFLFRLVNDRPEDSTP